MGSGSCYTAVLNPTLFCHFSFLKKRLHVQAREGVLGRGREKVNLKQSPCSARSPVWGSISQPGDHDLSGNKELDI